MLPTVLSHELMEGVEAFLRSTFPTSTPAFRHAFDEILHGIGRDKLFQGPYLRVGLPFQSGDVGNDFFKRLKTAYAPFRHQAEAWGRLRTENGESTLVATGTGSGKTECFLYPILDHVLANPADRGIKAIILYPMNALATDQARRFAAEVHHNPACRGKVRVGLYVGGTGDGTKAMSETGVITCRDEMRHAPPDVLMTNYKMLDYLLIRQADRGLWSENGPETLRYLVVDELHTFDGAQGTDLACLIRRVKARVKTPPGHLCCVGTSATLGGLGSEEAMMTFASLIFGEQFTDDAVIGERRKKPQEHIDNEDPENFEVRYFEPPGPEHHRDLSPSSYDSIIAYVQAQVPLWFGEDETLSLDTLDGRVALGNRLRRHAFVRTFLIHFTERPVVEEEALLADLAKRRGQWDVAHHKLILNSFISLCAVARNAPRDSAYFLQVRSELWMRELARMAASVSPQPVMRFSVDLPADHPQKHLAAIHCRDCGAMGWAALQKANEDKLIPDLDRFYHAFFSLNPDPRLCFVFPAAQEVPSSESLLDTYLCGACLSFFESKEGTCPECGTKRQDPDPDKPVTDVCSFPVERHQRTVQRKNERVADKSCPYCDSATGLTIVGSRAASLTSVALSQLFGSPFNDDKKAMAFSDSVQDASHRAGFFTARTYPIALRTALCQVIGCAEEGEEMSLATLSERFPQYWIEKLGKADFVGTFIPPTIEWLTEFESFKVDRKLPSGSKLPSKVIDRMCWEVIREFGMQSRVGRTLEKSGAAACYLAPSLLEEAADAFVKEVHELSSLYRALDSRDAKRLMMGVCQRLRVSGGIGHRFLESYIENKGNEYPFNQYNGSTLTQIPRPGRGIRPTFFASLAVNDTFERLLAKGSTPTWAERWVAKWLRALIGERAADAMLTPILEILVKCLTDAGVWRRFTISRGDHEYAWALDPRHVLVAPEAVHHACETCGHQVSTSPGVVDLWNAMPCLKHKCPGCYAPAPSSQGSFFGDLYRKGDVVRLRAAEHTGMLDRPTREGIEREFMRRPSLCTDIKLLSCTPTMEMGVDVGDLSSVVLCSVPPEQANYLQRVGRGGRRDGNSLALTVATSQAHDLSFYEAPLKMLAGEVEMPAIFLRAPAVLERQLTAFAIDRWIESDPSAVIPEKMDAIYMRISHETEPEDNAGAFPQALYRFIDLHLTELLEGFAGMFDKGELDDPSMAYLRAFIHGRDGAEGSLSYKMNAALAASLKDRDVLKKKRHELQRAIKRNKDQSPRDEKLDQELNDMTAERRGISRLIRDFNEKETLNFLTDEGLIPNYAFPEEGVTLRSVILKKTEKQHGDEKLVKLEFEHVRAAEAALTELAPGSSFYVEGRKLTIDRVAVEADDYEEWHFCHSCSHVEPVSTASESRMECPRCHCSGWRDTSLKQQMLKMRQVFVTAWDKQVRNLDQQDQRELTAFNKQVSIDFRRDAIRKSYGLRAEGATFAFDFLNLITLREVNFGEDRPDGNAIQIGGKHLQGIGFQICNACGKIQSKRVRGPKKHDISCPHFGKDTGDEKFETTFLLYRELKSEAIKLLIPSLSQDETVDTQSFVAAVHLGLKAHFGGHLTHLKLSVQHLPIGGSAMRTQHVYIYDSVPGGTGYLKDLTKDDRTLIDVIEKAYAVLDACPCAKDPNLDGCYQCINAYRFRFVHNQISRKVALRQMKLILDHRESIEERRPDEAEINPLLESELERRFIASLKETEGFQVNADIVEGRPGYLLKIGASAWNIVPQLDLGPSQGVTIPCRPDFVLKPLRPSKGLPMAVFLDGFAYHADVELDNNRIADDLAKRSAIRMSNRYLVWSLTWADLKANQPSENVFLRPAYHNLIPLIKERAGELAALTIFKDPNWNSWELLLATLRHLASSESAYPLVHWQTAASFLACNFPSRAPTDELSLEKALETMLMGRTPQLEAGDDKAYMSSYAHGEVFKLISAVSMDSIRNRRLDGALSALWFDDSGAKPAAKFQEEWRECLRMFNLLQFVPRFVCVTKQMVEKGLVSNVLEWLLQPQSAPTEPLESEEMEILELLAPELQSLLVPLLKSGALPWPELGYEATAGSGRCGTSMLEVAWPDLKTGIALAGDLTADFEEDGWRIFSADTVTEEDLRALFTTSTTHS